MPHHQMAWLLFRCANVKKYGEDCGVFPHVFRRLFFYVLRNWKLCFYTP